jgi:hypothetical protein
MTLSVNNFGSSPFAPGISADAFTPDQLIAGDMKVVTDTKTITGGAIYKRGTVLGQIFGSGSATVTPGTPVSGSGQTVGNGAVGTWTADAGAPAGTWQLVITNEATNLGNFKVLRPDLSIDGYGTVGTAYNGQINGTLADGSNDWKEDDVVPIAVSFAAEGSCTIATSAAIDGSSVPRLVLLDDVDATGGDVLGGVMQMGEVNGNALILGSGITLVAAKAALARANIYVKTPVSAADPT